MTPFGIEPAALTLMLLLGAYHGINPGMGWLFAVALGMQENRGTVVLRSLVPIAIGHALAIGSVVLIVAWLGETLPRAPIRYAVAGILIGLGTFRLTHHRHPRWVRMKVGFKDLTVWSFLMASAHGAGFMVMPVLLGSRVVEAAGHNGAHDHASSAGTALTALFATGVHTVGYLTVMGLVAAVVYYKLGLALLRRGWFNLDLVWAVALGVTGVVTLVM